VHPAIAEGFVGPLSHQLFHLFCPAVVELLLDRCSRRGGTSPSSCLGRTTFLFGRRRCDLVFGR
jgi:hypothetical protein